MDNLATADRASLTAHLARLTAEYTSVAEAYEDLMHWPVDDDRAALDVWRWELDRLYATKDALAAQRREARRLLLQVGARAQRSDTGHARTS